MRDGVPGRISCILLTVLLKRGCASSMLLLLSLRAARMHALFGMIMLFPYLLGAFFWVYACSVYWVGASR